MESSGATGQRWKVKIVSVSAQWARGLSKVRGSKECFLKAPLGTINVIFAALGRTDSHPFRVMSVARASAKNSNFEPKRAKVETPPALSFSDEDKVGTIQPHDDALVVTLRIGGYDMKKVMVEQGSGAEIMHPDLYKWLNLKPENLTAMIHLW